MAFMESEQIVEKVAEYLSIAPHISEFSPDIQYQRANQLALELAVWLDSDLYVELGQIVGFPNATHNPGTFIILVRKRYGNQTELSDSKIIVHAPGIGKKGKP